MDGLFDMEPVTLPEPEKLSPDRRRTLRQRRAIDAGRHPLEHVFPTYRHPDTLGQDYQPDDPRGRPLTCGSCQFRQVFAYHMRTYPKCVEGYQLVQGETGEHHITPRMSHGAASDVRAWWPACRKYEPGDSALSPDAARYVPGISDE